MKTEAREETYTAKHTRPEVIDVTREELRKLAEELPDGVILSVDLQEVIDEQENEKSR